jgi:hypothetical protein
VASDERCTVTECRLFVEETSGEKHVISVSLTTTAGDVCESSKTQDRGEVAYESKLLPDRVTFVPPDEEPKEGEELVRDTGEKYVKVFLSATFLDTTDEPLADTSNSTSPGVVAGGTTHVIS